MVTYSCKGWYLLQRIMKTQKKFRKSNCLCFTPVNNLRQLDNPLKFRYCEKATKFEKISHLFLNQLVTSNQSGGFFEIFRAFSDYLNFTRSGNVLKTFKYLI